MNVKSIGSNQAEIRKSNGDEVLVSYSTPVAACIGGTYYRTEQSYSNTTSRHISKWLDGVKAEVKPQKFFDNLI